MAIETPTSSFNFLTRIFNLPSNFKPAYKLKTVVDFVVFFWVRLLIVTFCFLWFFSPSLYSAFDQLFLYTRINNYYLFIYCWFFWWLLMVLMIQVTSSILTIHLIRFLLHSSCKVISSLLSIIVFILSIYLEVEFCIFQNSLLPYKVSY